MVGSGEGKKRVQMSGVLELDERDEEKIGLKWGRGWGSMMDERRVYRGLNTWCVEGNSRGEWEEKMEGEKRERERERERE